MTQGKTFPSKPFLQLPLFRDDGLTEQYSVRESIKRSYARASVIARAYEFTLDDILHMSDKLWDLHADPVSSIDAATTTILTIHYNLAVGTLAPLLSTRPDLAALTQKLLNFEIVGQFMLTEVEHGLDARQIETTATLLPDGSLDLNTPHPGAAKYMPPVTTISAMPTIGVVFARLIAEGKFYGIRPVLVSLTDGKGMCKGVSSRMVPPRSGSKPLDHSMTTFDHVRLPPGSVIGSLEESVDVRGDFLKSIWRISTGGLALSLGTVSFLSVGVYIAGKYSLRRMVSGPAKGSKMPIIGFRTQQLPILHGLAQIHVLQALSKVAIPLFRNQNLHMFVRHGISTIFKATALQHCQSTLLALEERCGAQGLFGYNQIVRGHADMRGVCIAEGDILTISIRLISELLQGKYRLPEPKYPDCLLYKHEQGLWKEARDRFSNLSGNHRSEEFNNAILPLCRPLVEFIGHRMAYEAAVDLGVNPLLVELYEAGAIRLDSSWYVENGLMSRAEQHDLESAAANKVLPDLERFLHDLEAAEYATAPIISEERWNGFVSGLPQFVGNSEPLGELWVASSKKNETCVIV
ncbi:acyl-CoA dehydrogenase NM domain-like protein [Lentinula boryana]|uniref:Acyl-CoA dehydrogenase NM domain-like protein n=1 Tax=Lentinula boryana TaxID=40481 RepID=A0ABQ8Q1G9_9AGAR|nr:acyl-CoA dehydrogenase NM domain-like protein [Lentinula boryana]